MSDAERQQYEFEGGGAATERKVGKRPGWFARLFRLGFARKDDDARE